MLTTPLLHPNDAAAAKKSSDADQQSGVQRRQRGRSSCEHEEPLGVLGCGPSKNEEPPGVLGCGPSKNEEPPGVLGSGPSKNEEPRGAQRRTGSSDDEEKPPGVLGSGPSKNEEPRDDQRRTGSSSDDEEKPPGVHILGRERGRNNAPPPPQVRPLCATSLADMASVLANGLRDTELADAAKAFAGKARKFARKSDRNSRLGLLLAGNNLAHAATGTPYAGDVSDVLLAAEAVLEVKANCLDAILEFFRLKNKERMVSDPNPILGSNACDNSVKLSWSKRLRTVISPTQPLLPTQDAGEDSLTGKRQILYAVALAAPVSLLTSAAGLHYFPGAWAWVAGAGVTVWILTSCGMVLNQYGKLDWEKLAARHLGRLGMLGAALMFSFYVYRAYFPSQLWALVILIVVALLGLGVPWIMSCIRGDDVPQGTEERDGGDGSATV